MVTSTDMLGRRSVLRAVGGMALAASGIGAVWAQSGQSLVSVWKTPNCGCCKLWIDHLQANGFKVTATDVRDTSEMRSQLNMPLKYASCHTAVVDGYIIEGHVPAREIKRLLRERPKALGLSVPGMPMGSPGMEMGSQRDAYQVLLIAGNGTSRVYQSYPSSN